MSNLNVGMLRMHEFFFLERWVEMGLWGTNVCIFVGGKEHLLSKDSNDNIVHWRAKKPSILSEINSDTNILCSIATGVWIIVSFLKSPSQPCLVSSRNGHSPRLLPVFHQRQNQNYSLTAGCLKNNYPHDDAVGSKLKLSFISNGLSPKTFCGLEQNTKRKKSILFQMLLHGHKNVGSLFGCYPSGICPVRAIRNEMQWCNKGQGC